VVAVDMQVSVLDSDLADNQAESGGAIYTLGSCNLGVHSSGFASNNASYGGALMADELSNMSVKACLFEDNTAVGGGGALHALAQAQVGSTIGHAAVVLLQLTKCKMLQHAQRCTSHVEHFVITACRRCSGPVVLFFARHESSLTVQHIDKRGARALLFQLIQL
jgi:predicted outer membrane repeat protein